MTVFPPTFADDVLDQPLRAQFEAFLDEHRQALRDCLDGLTEEQARRSLVPSRTTLLGLVKHATFVEKVWFDEAVTCRSRAEIGIPATPDESFGLTEEQARASLVPSRTTLLGLVKHATFVEQVWFDEAITCCSRAEIGIPATPDESFELTGDDTVAGVLRTYREACAASRRAVADLGPDDLVHGNRRGPLPLRWVYLHMLRELAQHCGHADILREQVLAEAAGP
jgi:hypothetical protein